ncbi:MAG: response regulator [Firmicutes bacterium]|nr:response regulator [Bacillota bacterium]
MVTLALKDHDIEVIAVGNGEAAVRKLADYRPHLILADVFMPVRNGYELCEFVKKNPKLAGIPVILLVGAFDPLDDEEVRRVGADGVLKKPFVPPDPLIHLVKAKLAEVAPPSPSPSAQPAPHDLPPAIGPTPRVEATHPEPEVEEFSVGPDRLEIRSEDSPLAFQALLESDAVQTDASDASTPAETLAGESGAATESTEDSFHMPVWPGWRFDEAESETPPPAPSAQIQTSLEDFPEPLAEKLRVEAPQDHSVFAPSSRWSFLEEPTAPADPLAAAEPAPAGAPWPTGPEEAAGAIEALAETDEGRRLFEESSGMEEEQPRAVPSPSPAEEAEPELAASAVLGENPSLSPVESVPAAPPASKPTGEASSREPAATSPASASPDPALLESVVDQLVERLLPQIEQAAREALRPLAEQILRRELETSQSSGTSLADRERVRS